jgi:hypothetical protein
MKNDKFKKNHFWILLGLVPLLVLIAALMVSSSVGGAISARNDEIKKSEDSIKGKTPKSLAVLAALDVVAEKVKKKKVSLWEENWNRQKDLYVWPNETHLQAVEKMNLKFGDKIPDDDFTYDKFRDKEVYLAQFSSTYVKPNSVGQTPMADMVAPTQFAGGWERVLRHVTSWGNTALSSEQIWLVMEDVWVERSLLSAIQSVNQQMADFHRVKYVKDKVVLDDPSPKAPEKDPLRRRFESRTWALELEVKTEGTKRYLTGKLINLTNRLQLMGINNTMILNVWLNSNPTAQPFEFRIGGEFLPGDGATKIKKIKDKDGKETGQEETVAANVLDIDELTKDNLIPPSYGDVTEIARVEQKLDMRTVPIRRIEALELGFRDSRHAASQLFQPTFPAWAPKEGDAPSGGTTAPERNPGVGGSSLGGPPAGIPMGPPSVVGGIPGVGGMPGVGGGTAQQTGRGGGPIDAVINGNKKRYIMVNPQVRRMPVGVVVVVDQAYLQDVLLAFANSPLRFQITQVTWKRFRGQLDGLGTGGSTGPAGDYVPIMGGGNFSSDFNIPAPTRPGGSSFGPPMGVKPPFGPPSVPPMTTGGAPPTMPLFGQNPPGGMGFGGSGTLTTVSESQLTAGLIELSVYGIVSLYEKYSPEIAEAAAKDPNTKDPNSKEPAPKDTTPKDPNSKEPGKKESDPKDKGPMPKDPMLQDPKTPKMRRRIR